MKRSRWLWAFSFGAFTMNSPNLPPAYIAYIDESGDPGLRQTASDWFIPSAAVIRTEDVALPREWISSIKSPMKNQKRADLHFTKLNPGMKARACKMLASLPVKCLTNISRKANMLHHRNLAAENRPARRQYRDDGTWFILPQNDWFQNWMTKLLVERITWFCAKSSLRRYGRLRTVEIVIGTRDGFYIDDFIDYLKLDQSNELNGTSTLKFHPNWNVIDWEKISEAPAANVPGLQLADIVCGAFLHAVDKKRYGTCNPQYAKELITLFPEGVKPGIPYTKEEKSDYSVSAWPRPLNKGNRPLTDDQWEIFRHYGFDERKWLGRPGPTSSGR